MTTTKAVSRFGQGVIDAVARSPGIELEALREACRAAWGPSFDEDAFEAAVWEVCQHGTGDVWAEEIVLGMCYWPGTARALVSKGGGVLGVGVDDAGAKAAAQQLAGPGPADLDGARLVDANPAALAAWECGAPESVGLAPSGRVEEVPDGKAVVLGTRVVGMGVTEDDAWKDARNEAGNGGESLDGARCIDATGRALLAWGEGRNVGIVGNVVDVAG